MGKKSLVAVAVAAAASIPVTHSAVACASDVCEVINTVCTKAADSACIP